MNIFIGSKNFTSAMALIKSVKIVWIDYAWTECWSEPYKYLVTKGLNKALANASQRINLVFTIPATRLATERQTW